MHAGNIFAALVTWLLVRSEGGRIVLRIDDLDRERSKPEFIDGVQRDFEMLGLTWDDGPYFQQGREEAYQAAFESLKDVYPCFCTRADLHAASAPHAGEKPVYAGTCRGLTEGERAQRMLTREPAWRVEVPDRSICFNDLLQGEASQDLRSECGDFVVRRANGEYAYQLACVVDDAEQGVNLIVRGADLLDSTPQQIFLQDELHLPRAQYAHVPLLLASDGRRLSKRDRDASLEEMLACFKTPQGVLGHIAYVGGLQPVDEPVSPEQLLDAFDASSLKGIKQIAWE